MYLKEKEILFSTWVNYTHCTKAEELRLILKYNKTATHVFPWTQ